MRTRFAFFVLLTATLGAQPKELGPPPGSLVDIGGRKLHVHCTGGGAPTVVLEAGASAFAIDWSLVEPEVARTNRVCSYDRAGSGWSDRAPWVETPARVVADLHAALKAAGEKPPYVLAGASMGGIYVRLYDLTYPGEVAGMVLVDPSSEERLFTMFDGKGVVIASLTAEQMRSTVPAGPVRVPRREPQTGAPFDKLPKDLYESRVLLDRRLIDSIPTSIPPEIIAESAEGQRAAFAKLRAAAKEHPFGDRPLVVLTRGVDSSEDMKVAHAAIARQSTNSRHTVVANSGHEIHLYQPAVVVQAIRDVVESERKGEKLAKS